MKQQCHQTNYREPIIVFTANMICLLLFLDLAWADDSALLKGCWKCQEEGVPVSLEFVSEQQL